jgi:hypothetical protein
MFQHFPPPPDWPVTFAEPGEGTWWWQLSHLSREDALMLAVIILWGLALIAFAYRAVRWYSARKAKTVKLGREQRTDQRTS